MPTVTIDTIIDHANLIGEGEWIKNAAYQVYELDGRYYAVIVCNQMNKDILDDSLVEISLDDIPKYV